MCGEKDAGLLQVPATKGSPPRVRGKVPSHSCIVISARITPACAGKSRCTLKIEHSEQDHPRVCGEKSFAFQKHPEIQGSPPRVRGKGSNHIPVVGDKGITPACAGKSSWTEAGRRQGGDHPRVCGEKAGSVIAFFGRTGSPPRVRGKVFGGIAVWQQSEDHPRVCGEKSRPLYVCEPFLGSPPRVRGKAVPAQ